MKFFNWKFWIKRRRVFPQKSLRFKGKTTPFNLKNEFRSTKLSYRIWKRIWQYDLCENQISTLHMNSFQTQWAYEIINDNKETRYLILLLECIPMWMTYHTYDLLINTAGNKTQTSMWQTDASFNHVFNVHTCLAKLTAHFWFLFTFEIRTVSPMTMYIFPCQLLVL